jgi:hypothetical protein
MARGKVDQIIEHRVTLGKFERTELKQSLDLMQKKQQNALYKDYAIGAATGAAALGGVYVAYKAVGLFGEIGETFSGVWATINGIGLDDITDFIKKGGGGTPSPWKIAADKANPFIRGDEFDIRYMQDEDFLAKYLMTKGEYMQNYKQGTSYQGMNYPDKPNPDNYCNGRYNCGIPEQQAHYEKYGNGFGL